MDLEADQVCAWNAPNQLLMHGKTAEDLGAGKGHMQEEANLGVGQRLPDHTRHQQQVVVVHPDGVVCFYPSWNSGLLVCDSWNAGLTRGMLLFWNATLGILVLC